MRINLHDITFAVIATIIGCLLALLVAAATGCKSSGSRSSPSAPGEPRVYYSNKADERHHATVMRGYHLAVAMLGMEMNGDKPFAWTFTEGTIPAGTAPWKGALDERGQLHGARTRGNSTLMYLTDGVLLALPGSVDQSTHEWAHLILTSHGVAPDNEKQHEIMRRKGFNT